MFDIDSAIARGTDPDCRVAQDSNRAANHLAYGVPVTDPILKGLGEVCIRFATKEYDATVIPAQQQVYFAPHRPGKPESFDIQYRFDYFGL